MCPWIQYTVNTHPSQGGLLQLSATAPSSPSQTGWWQWCEAVVLDQGNSVWAPTPRPPPLTVPSHPATPPPRPPKPPPPPVVSRARRDPRAFRFSSPDLFIFITTMKISMMPNAYAHCTPPRLFVCACIYMCVCASVCVCVYLFDQCVWAGVTVSPSYHGANVV